jgi:tetratricopeptide (TPR) repeat protein
MDCLAKNSESGPADGRVRAYWIWAVCGFLLLAVGLVFGQTVRQGFIEYDDPAFVYENPHVAPGLSVSGVWWALTDGTFGEWCPLSSLSHMLDCEIYGLDPAGHHLTNVLLHAASSVLLFLVLLRMSGSLWPSAWVAAIFAVHPLHVESVAWVAERRDVLSGLFFMLTLFAYALYAERPSMARILAVAGCFALGLMAKPIVVTVPCLLLLLDYWPLDRFRDATGARRSAELGWRLVAEKIPLIVLAAVTCWIVLSTHSSMRGDNPLDEISLSARLSNALVSYAAYLGKSFYPVDLAFYPLRSSVPLAQAAGALVLLVAITGAAVYGGRRRPYLLVGWLWFLGMLVPVIGLVQRVAVDHADRYTYLSQIGLSIALAWSVSSANRSRHACPAARWRQGLLAVASGGAVLLLGVVAWRQTAHWRDFETLWTHALACTEQNPLAHYNLGYTYAKLGRTEEAIVHLREASAAESIDRQVIAKSYCVLGDCLKKQRKLGEAFACYEQAVRTHPAEAIFHDRLAKALSRRGEPDRAIAEWREIIRLEPNAVRGHLGLADALLANGEAADAIAECREVLQKEPNSIDAIVVLGGALAAQGKVEEAISPLMQALESDPDNARAHFRLGLALNDLGRPESALAHLNEALLLQPDNVQMLWHLAWILATSPDRSARDGARGIELATRAIELSEGHDARAHDALAAALAETGNFSAAIDAAEQAVAQARGDEALVDAVGQRTRLYRQSLPYRQPARPLAANAAPAGQAAPAAAK